MTLALISVNQSLARAHHALRPRTLPSHAFIDRRGVAILPGQRDWPRAAARRAAWERPVMVGAGL